MMRLVFILAIVFSTGALFAQRYLAPTWLDLGPKKAFVGAYGFGSVSSAQLSNSFLLNISGSSHLDAQVKERQLTQFTNSNNLIGGDYSLGIQGGFTLPNWCAGIVFSATDEAHLNAIFPGDFGRFVLDGNKQFAGEEANFNRTTLSVLRYQKVGVGLNFQPSEGVSYGGMISFLNGESTASLNIGQGSVYTSSIGDSMLLQLRGSAYYSDTSNTGFLRHNGGGTSIDLFFTQHVEAFGSLWEVNALLMNFGMIQWHPETERYNADTSVLALGIQINDFNNSQAAINAYNLEDSLLGGVRAGFSRRTVNQMIPGYMQLEFKSDIEQGVEAGAGLVVRWQTISRTYAWFNAGYRFNRAVAVTSEFGYGGYGAFQAGLGASYRTNSFAATVRIANVEAAIAPKTFGGITLGCGVQYFFGI
jgi:hypothetical protein